MYHSVVSKHRQPARYWIREAEFAQQMDSLKALGAVTPPLDSVVAWLAHPGEGCPFPPHAVLITFDLDGESRHEKLAVPHLLRNGFKAIFFVPLMALDHPPNVSSVEVAALAQAGMTIGSHTEHHYDMRYEHPDSMVASLMRTRELLGSLSGQPIATLSAPGGRYNDSVVAGVERAGFTSFFTSDPCYVLPDSRPRTLCRIEVRGDGGITAQDAMLKPWGVAVQATDWAIKRRVEAMVGGRFWFLFHTIRQQIDGPGY
jgi:peptidoglycan/xylan/chitin deacetylase (PgdA/CDA1 family)